MSNYHDLTSDDLPGVSQEEIDQINAKNRAILLEKEKTLPKTAQDIDALLEAMPLTASVWDNNNESFQALQAIADSVPPFVRAENYKNHGNECFKEASLASTEKKLKNNVMKMHMVIIVKL